MVKQDRGQKPSSLRSARTTYVLALAIGSAIASGIVFLGFGVQYRNLKGTATSTVPSLGSDCLNEPGPIPVILLSLGRSGTDSTFQIMGNLTGTETQIEEYTGGNAAENKKFLDKHTDHKWLEYILCKTRRKYPDAAVVGMKWKSYWSQMTRPGSTKALRYIREHPMIRLVRSRRNLLDVIISRTKHDIQVKKTDKMKLWSHCNATDLQCQEDHKQVSKGMHLPTFGLLHYLRVETHNEDSIDKLLIDMEVPHVSVTYDNLYGEEAPLEWQRLFEFVGKGPSTGLTSEKLHNAMGLSPTHLKYHNMTLSNYKSVHKRLKGTKFEKLLH